MEIFEYLARKHHVTPVFVEKLSYYNNCINENELEQLVIDQINYLKTGVNICED